VSSVAHLSTATDVSPPAGEPSSAYPNCFTYALVTDPFARLPEFLEHFHRLLAKAQNASLGRWEKLWSSDKTSVVLLVSDEDVLEKMAYTITNPTAAGLVRSPLEWPGVMTTRIDER
jgi:putative transposase